MSFVRKFALGLCIVAVLLPFFAGAEEQPETIGYFEFSPKAEAVDTLVVDGRYYATGGEWGSRLVSREVDEDDAEWTVSGDSPDLGNAPFLTVLASAPEDLRGFWGTACGKSHVVFLNGNREDDRILAYQSIFDKWIEIGQLPWALKATGISSDSSGTFTVSSADGDLVVSAILQPTLYHWVNHLVVAALLLSILGIGAVMARREKSAGDYFRAGSRIPWWAAGLSMFAAMASAISLMAMPSNGFAENWIYFLISIFTVLIQLPIFLIYYVPLARRLKVAIANEYLERRYGLPARMLGFAFLTLTQVLIRVGSVLLLPSLALNAIFGLDLQTCILIMGGVTMLFVTLSGLEAVVWADVLQAIVMVSAIVICMLWVLTSLDMVPSEAWTILKEHNKLMLFDFSMHFSKPVEFVLAANILVYALGLIGDQSFIQRVQCTYSENESRKAMVTQLAVAVPLNFILFTLGTLLFLYYFKKPAALNPAMDPQQVFPFFAANNLPPGLPGLVVAALLAATMSTEAGALNSVANLGMEDVYRRFNKGATDHKCLVLGWVLTVVFGVLGTGFAFWRSFYPRGSVWNFTFELMGVVTAPLMAMYVLGIFTKRANNSGIWVGALGGVGAYFFVKYSGVIHLNALGYLPFCALFSVVVGYVFSLILPARKVDLTGLTAYTLLDKETMNED